MTSEWIRQPTDRELIQKTLAGEVIPLPSALLEQPNGNFFAFGYILGLKEPGKDFANGIRTYMKSDHDLTILRTTLQSIASKGVILEDSFLENTWRQYEELLQPPYKDIVTILSTGFYGTLAGLFGGPTAAVLVGLATAIITAEGLSYIDRKLVLKTASDRARILLSLFPRETKHTRKRRK